MSTVTANHFVYVTYIRTTPQQLWAALTSADFTRQYWMGMRVEAEWRPGGSWRLLKPDGTLADAGEIIECEPGKRLVIRWRHEMTPELKAEGWSQCTMDLEPVGNAVKLTVTHRMEREGGRFIAAVAGGWPQVLSNLKSLLETGSTLLPTRY